EGRRTVHNGGVDPIGIVTGRSTPQAFTFVSEEATVPPRLEYVVIQGGRERIDDQAVQVDLLAQVTNISADVMTLDDGVDFGEAQTILDQAGTFPPRGRAEANLAGFPLAGGGH